MIEKEINELRYIPEIGLFAKDKDEIEVWRKGLNQAKQIIRRKFTGK